MKTVFIGDEYNYLQLNEFYKMKDESGNVVVNDFDRDLCYNIFHLQKKEYINYLIDPYGLRGTTHVIIQKSYYKCGQLIKILKRFRIINPTVKVVIYIDDDPIYYQCLMSRIVKNRLAHIACSLEELNDIFSNEFNIDQSMYILKRETRAQKKDYDLY